jgi:hypothetical protein
MECPSRQQRCENAPKLEDHKLIGERNSELNNGYVTTFLLKLFRTGMRVRIAYKSSLRHVLNAIHSNRSQEEMTEGEGKLGHVRMQITCQKKMKPDGSGRLRLKVL